MPSSDEPDGPEKKIEFRRRAPRVRADSWPARFFDQENPASGVRDCRIIDMSLLGVGVEVFGEMTEHVIGHRIEIYVRAPLGESVSLRLVGHVRHLAEARSGVTRAGVEFEGLSETELDILNVLSLLKISW